MVASQIICRTGAFQMIFKLKDMRSVSGYNKQIYYKNVANLKINSLCLKNSYIYKCLLQFGWDKLPAFYTKVQAAIIILLWLCFDGDLIV